MWVSFLQSLVFGLGLGYLILLVVAWRLADRLIFPRPPPSYRDDRQILKLPLPDGSVISALHLPNPRARFTLLLSHGNYEDLGGLAPFLEELRQHGFAVFAFDYPGYGTSTGEPSEAAAYAAIDAAFLYLRNLAEVPPERIIAYGRSVGGGPGTYLAAREPLGGLILQSAFTSAFRVVTRRQILPWDKFDNLARLPRVRCPVLVIHGTADEIVPFAHGQRLFDAAPGPKSFLWVDQAGHNDLLTLAGPAFPAALHRFRDSLP